MKKILCIIDYLDSGGAQRQMVGLASCLKKRGYDVVLATYYDSRFYLHDLSSQGVSYVYLKEAEKTATRLFHVARFIRRERPDVVISYLETPSLCASFAKLFNHGFKLIVSERNTTQQTGLNERIRFNLFRIADYVVPNAYSQEEYIKRTFPFLSDKVVTIPNFVDLDYFVPAAPRPQRPVPEVMVAASIWEPKNTLGLIDAAAELKNRGHKFHISWYGWNEKNKEYGNQCQDKIEQLGVKDCIELKEKTTQIKDCYQDSDFFCLPSFYEGTPNVICEALACGLPVVCSDVCDNTRYVLEGENGFLFNPKDTASMVSAFEKLFALSDSAYLAFREKSRKIAECKLSIDKFVSSYVELVKS